MSNYFVIDTLEEEELSTIKYRIISSETFKKNWTLLGQVLGFYMFPQQPMFDLSFYKLYPSLREEMIKYNLASGMRVTKSGSNYILHYFEDISPSEHAYIEISNIKFEFIPDTLSFGEPEINDIGSPKNIVTRNLSNADDSTTSPYKYIFNTSSHEKTTISSAHRLVHSIKIKASFKHKFPVVTVKGSASFKYTSDRTLGNQEETLISTEIFDEVNLNIPPQTRIPFKLMSYTKETTVPYTALAVMSYNITFKGPLNKFGSPHKTLRLPPSLGFSLTNFEHTFGNDKISAEEDILNQTRSPYSIKKSIWDWDRIMLISREDLHFYKNITNGFAAKFQGEFNSVSVQNIKMQVDDSIKITEDYYKN